MSTTVEQKKVHFETWGCQMNVADSEKMLSALTKEQYALTEKPEDADLIVLNTCHIREKAYHKVVSRLGVLKDLKSKNPDLTIAVTGCVAQAEGKKLFADGRGIDLVLGPGKIEMLPELVRSHKENNTRSIAIGFDKREHHEHGDSAEEIQAFCQKDLDPVPSVHGRNEISRFVTIQQGCNNFCTFCVVPHTRGREISIHPDIIVHNVKKHLQSGAKEITLLGQNVNSYGLDLLEKGRITAIETPFVDLLTRLVSLDGLLSLRFTTSNPHDFTKPLADLFGKYPVLGKYIHLPVQSGSDPVLDKMRRKVTRLEYMQRIKWLREAVPDIAISTDLIVGFPGETEEDFAETMSLVEECQFSFIYSFKYSKRKGTAAVRFTDQVPENIKDLHLQKLNALQDEITVRQHQAEIGQEREVLFLYESKKEPGTYFGRSEHFRLVRVPAQRDIIGKKLKIRITGGNKIALLGELV